MLFFLSASLIVGAGPAFVLGMAWMLAPTVNRYRER